MKNLFLGISIAFTSANCLAQQTNTNLIPCTTYEVMERAFAKDPAAKLRFEEAQTQLRNEKEFVIENQSQLKTAATVFTVPVVFHILHQNGPENVSDAFVISALEQVNKDFRKQGSDIATISPLYASLYVDAEIQFVLAKKDPTGKCTNGIIRHFDANTYWNQDTDPYPYTGAGANKWPTNKYLNVYLVSCISSPQDGVVCPTPSGSNLIGGYTWLPGTWGTNSPKDAIVYRSDLLSGTNARSLSHEIGHWLDLYHTFGQTNNPGAYACTSTLLDDYIGDTPKTKGNFSNCPSSGGTNTCDASTNHNVENIMNYSSCPKMFTQGQITAMRTAIQSSVGGRSTLISNTNLIAAGVSGVLTCTPVADFSSNKTTICSNQTVIYTNKSQVGTSGSLSWNFQGGTPATSTATSVTVTYPSAGIYSVSLVATNSTGSNTLNKTSYVNAVNGFGGYTSPIAHSFEDGNLPAGSNIVNPNAGSVAWAVNNGNGANGTSKSIYLNNITANTAGHLDVFETPIYNLNATSNVSLSYWYAYAKKTASQADTFRLQYSLDCGGTWSNVLGFTSIGTMANNSGGVTASAFVPTAAQWKQTNIASSLLSAINNKPSVKFRFYFRAGAGGANNIYFDEINLNGTVGLNEFENNLELSIYPNPAKDFLEIKFVSDESATIELKNTLGQVVFSDKTNSNTHSIATNHLSSGVYILNLTIKGQSVSKKIIIE